MGPSAFFLSQGDLMFVEVYTEFRWFRGQNPADAPSGHLRQGASQERSCGGHDELGALATLERER